MKSFHTQPVTTVLQHFGVDAASGVSGADAQRAIEQHGANELTHAAGKRPWRILAEQFASLLVILLIAAAVVSFALGDAKDAVAILVIVILNALLGFRQEYRAEKAMAALRKLSAPKVRVRRDGQVREIDTREVVPGDMVLLEAGNLVPADGRLVECAALRVREAALTGEAEGVGKHTDPIEDGEVPLGDRRNMVYMGTVVTYGRGVAVVTDIGMRTELGKVATLLQETEDEATPLARKLDQLGRRLVFAAVGLIALVAVTGILRAQGLKTVFLTAVSMAVAAVPEGLPAVVTIALALGAQRMLARRALIRQLPAVETLGSVTAICTDKTGTLTQNRMTVTVLDLPDRPVIALSGSLEDEVNIPTDDHDRVRLLLSAAALCNDATLSPEEGNAWNTLGDPTEGALVVAAARSGLDPAALLKSLPRIGEAPFDSDRKRMATLHQIPDDGSVPRELRSVVDHLRQQDESAAGVVFVKGGVDSLLEVATRELDADGARPLDDSRRQKILGAMEALASDGVRVLGIAFRMENELGLDHSAATLEHDLVFLGLAGMMDPLRDEVKDAVATCASAGIRTVMITGDHPLMARSIGRELGIAHDGEVLSGRDLTGMSAEDLQLAARTTSVYARVSPEDKLKIVDALQADGEIVSMTGDGVNDAPALKSADIGVAMGITGTDVAKEASDMVLMDDRFTTIVAAVEEGRVIFDNIRRFIRFILASNTGELLVMLLAPFFGMPLPLVPVQILWMNLVTDGLPALALGVEKGERDVMARPPRDPAAPIVGWRMGGQIVWIGLLMAALSLAAGLMHWNGGASVAGETGSGHHGEVAASTWQTMLFTAMVFTQLALALGVRSSRDSLFTIGLFSNRPMVGALVLTVALQLAVIYVPPLQSFFSTVALTGRELAVCVGAGVAILLAVELEKLVRRLRSPAQTR